MKSRDQWIRYWRKVEKVLSVRVTPSYRKLLMDMYSEEQFEAALADLPAYIGSLEFGQTPKASMFEQVLKELKEPKPEPELEPELPASKVEPEPEKAEGGEPIVWWLDEHPDVPDYIKGLPNLVKALMECCLNGTDRSLDYALAGALAAVAAAVGNRIKIYSWGNVYCHSNEYTLLIGKTVKARKSRQITWVHQLMKDVNSDLLAPHARSWQGLAAHLEDNPSALWCIDEWSGILGELKSQEYYQAMRGTLLTLQEHGGVWKMRLARLSVTVDEPALSILGGIQSRIFAQEMLTAKDIEGGLVNRFLLIIPEEGQRDWPSLEWDVRETQRSRCIRKLRELGQAGSTVYAGHIQPMVTTWSDEPKEFFGESGEIVAARASMHIIKTAVNLWAADVGMPPNRMEIPLEYGEHAMRVLEPWFLRAATFVDEEWIKVPGEAIRRDILKFIQGRDGEEATVKDIGKFIQLSSRQLREHLDTLYEREVVVRRLDDADKEVYRYVG